MAKFGLFQKAGEKPIQVFEADYMLHEGDIVTFLTSSPTGDKQVGIVKLDVNQSIKQIQP